MSILRIELRRSAAVGAALLALTVGVATLYLARGRWSDGWLSLALTTKEYMILLWPIALAAGAWQGRREHRAKVGELFDTTPRSPLRRMLPVLVAMGATLGLAYVLVVVAGGVQLASTAGYFPPDVVAIVLVGAFSLVAATWLGLGIGRLLPALVTAPVLAVAGVLLVFFTAIMQPDWMAAVLSPAYGSGSFYPFQTIDAGVTAALAIWMVGLALTGVLLLVARNPRVWLAAALPVLLGFGAAAAIVPRDEATLVAPVDPVARELVCTDDAPKVCVTRIHANVLDTLTPLAREGLAVLAKLPNAPTQAHEERRAYLIEGAPARDLDVVTVFVRIDERGGLAHPDVVVPEMVFGLGIGYADTRCERNGAVERAAAYYLLGRQPVSAVEEIPEVFEEDPETTAEAVALWQGLRKLPEPEALSRVTAVRDAILACRDSTGLLSR
ncbi:membrane protein [Micromonospora sp. NRRL B-16802]|uniref:ABC transporter permease n=1 Tax=Micromonospora sp. NRRL B-16802 TaxID=1415541 RepID=UPI0006AF83D5|nr:ABC transporter permease [Micromonospora sp. NRRL B-16802]KOX10616.1 membrane protein [Micromonospora sp. NRRL B-16802]